MPPDDTAVIDRPPQPPAPVAATGFGAFSIAHLPLSLQIFFNPELNRQCVSVANYLSKAEGMTPAHLVGKHEACFAVVARSLTWRLDPFAVACATYQTPDKRVGYHGSLCQSIIENSGRLEGGVSYSHYGDWSSIRGRFKVVERPSSRDNNRMVRAPEQGWTDDDEVGLGVTVRALVKGEALPRELNFDMVQAYPRYSTLWITDPQTQICYTAVRRFANSVVPALFMGVPFDREEYSEWADTLRDVTPARPQLAEYGQQGEPVARGRRRRAGEDPAAGPPSPAKKFFFADADGVLHESENFETAVAAYAEMLTASAKQGEQPLIAAWENGAQLMNALREAGHNTAADAISQEYSHLVAEVEQRAQPAAGATQPGPATLQQPVAGTATSGVPRAAGELPLAGSGAIDVEVPRGVLSSEGWHKVARARLKDMETAKRPAADFQLFRQKNAEALRRLNEELPNWWTILDKAITAGGG